MKEDHKANIILKKSAHYSKNIGIKNYFSPKDNLDNHIVIEIGNSPKLWHLGTVRLLLYADRMASILKNEGKKVTIVYISTDLVNPMVAESRYIRYYFNGLWKKNPTRILGIKKSIPSGFQSPPSELNLKLLKNNLIDLTKKNSFILNVQKKISSKIIKKINDIFQILINYANKSQNFAEWTEVVNWYFTSPLMANGYQVYRGSRIIYDLDMIENQISEKKLFWNYCPSHKKRLNFNKSCSNKCSPFLIKVPKVELRQALSIPLGVKKRVVGGIYRYSSLSDQISKKWHGFSIPRFVVSGKVFYFGIGEPKLGCQSPSLLRVLFENDYLRLKQDLFKTLDHNKVIIRSPYL